MIRNPTSNFDELKAIHFFGGETILTKLIDKDMFQEFKADAIWSLNQDFSDHSWGSLSYDLRKGCTASVHPSFINEIQQFSNRVIKHSLFGMTKKGEFIIGDGYCIGSEFNQPGFSSEKIQLLRLDIQNFNPKGIFNPHSVIFAVTDCDYWLPNQPLKGYEKAVGVVAEKASSKPIGDLKFKGTIYKLQIGYGSQYKSQKFSHLNELRLHSYFVLNSDQKLDRNNSIDLINKITVLYEIICKTASLRLVKFSDGKHKINTFLSQNHRLFLDGEYSPNSFFLEYKDVKDKLPLLITNWLDASEELKMLIDDYLLTVHFSSVTENNFINYMQGIDSFYRKQNLSLQKKLKQFLKELPDSYRKILQDNINGFKGWTQLVVDTRVYMTHGDREDRAIKDPYRLIKLSHLFRFLIRVFILQQLGFNIDIPKLRNKLQGVLNEQYI